MMAARSHRRFHEGTDSGRRKGAHLWGFVVAILLLIVLFPLAAHAIENSASGSHNGVSLNVTGATVTLIRNSYPAGGWSGDNLIPAAQITQATDGTGIVTIRWKARDSELDRVTLKSFNYSDDGGANWYVPDNADTSAALQSGWSDDGGVGWSTAATLAGAEAHSFTFNTKHADVASVHSLDGVDQSDIQIRFLLNDGYDDAENPVTSEDLRIDNAPPTDSISGGRYDALSDTLILTGSGFTTIAPAGSEIKSTMTWAKFVWDINGDDAVTADITFAVGDVSSLTVTDDSTLTLLLTAAKGAAIEAAAGYGPAGGLDTLDIEAGFSMDAFGNVAATDGVSNAPLTTTDSHVTLTESDGTTRVTEAGERDSYTLALDTPPAGTVTVTVTPDMETDLGAGAGTALDLLFTTSNWMTAQTVTVTAVNDGRVEGEHQSTITHKVLSSDAGYDGIAVADVTVTITDNDTLPLASSTVEVDPEIVVADGVDSATITTTLIDADGNPVPRKAVTYASDRGIIDSLTQPAAITGADGKAVGAISSLTIGRAIITATDTTDTIELSARPAVYFTQGRVLEVTKSANKEEVVVGDLVTYEVTVSNLTVSDVLQVKLDDAIPPNFKYLKGSVRIDGKSAADPSGNRTLRFDLGTIEAMGDANGNGRADAGEAGHRTVSYQLIVGSGARPGKYTNSVIAVDVCDGCYISNESKAEVEVTLDPIFDLGTIIGKVFEDRDGDGRQSAGEKGVAGAMVVLDDGTYILTDEHGRYHFPAVRPGQRMLKLNVNSLAVGAAATDDEIRILSVTEGLLAKANFGVRYEQDVVTLGRDAVAGIGIDSMTLENAVNITGNVEALKLLLNGDAAALPLGDVTLGVEKMEEVVAFNGSRLEGAIEFRTALSTPERIKSWHLRIHNASNEEVHRFSGNDAPMPVIHWDGRINGENVLKGGEIYQYQMEAVYEDKTTVTSTKRLFGVNRTSAISLNLTGSAFEFGSFRLSKKAMEALDETAGVLEKYSDEKIIIEGHSDALGDEEINLALSKKRAEAARDYLVNEKGLPAKRFVVNWYGESKPMAGNETEEGRELNRRVEIKGEFSDVALAKIYDQYRTLPMVRINGQSVPLTERGHFSREVDAADLEVLEIEAVNSRGGSVKAAIPVPSLEIVYPAGEEVIAYGAKSARYDVSPARGEAGLPLLTYEMMGRTDPGNRIELDGAPLSVADDGLFKVKLSLDAGVKRYDLLITNPQGLVRITDLYVDVRDGTDDGKLLLLVTPVPYVTVNFPPQGKPLTSEYLTLSGRTDSKNRLYVNGEPVEIKGDGYFSKPMKLNFGTNRFVVRVQDREGYEAVIERDVEMTDTDLFFLAFVDGKIGQMKGKGYLKGAGMEKESAYYKEGRIALYLKGVIAGKYLITSAFDTGTREFGDLFKDLDGTENDRLFTNLDPDKLYPVYGDSSTLVNDAQSQGKFYLALESDELKLLIGNYPVSLSGTELAAYQRTLYGGNVSYQSSRRTRYGNPETAVTLFGAEVKQAHINDELRATGGSLYYLSHDDIIEGSEQVTITVRDKNTGLVLSRTALQRDRDYSIKYVEGRILFNRPVASFAADDRLADGSLLAGNPVSIEVDYESRLDSFEKTATGGRVRQQLGDHVALGATYVSDENATGAYELEGVDTEILLKKNTRLLAEIARSTGVDSLRHLSSDGGLTYAESTPAGAQQGGAWKVAAELDLGEWYGRPGEVQLGGYVKALDAGFISGGNFLEKGTRKFGLNTNLKITERDTLLARHDREEMTGEAATAPGAAVESESTTVQWTHRRSRWSLAAEYFSTRSLDQAGGLVNESGYGVTRLDFKATEKLSLSLEHQATLSGPDNDQTTAGAQYQVNESIALRASGTKGTLGRAAEGGALFSLNGGQAYLTKRIAEDQAGRTSATVLGGESRIGESTRVYSEYQWVHADRGDQSVSLVGAQRDWALGKGFNLMAAAEHSAIDATPQKTGRYSVAVGLSYSNAKGLKASTRNEVRHESGSRHQVQQLTSNHLELKLNADFTLLAHYRYSVTKDHDSGEKQAGFSEVGTGIAFRPVDNDRLNMLGKFTHLSDMRPLSLTGAQWNVTKINVASIEWSYELGSDLEWVGKQAMKVKTEQTGDRPAFTSHTWLTIQRLNFHVTRRIDVGAEYRILRQKEADDQREGWLSEVAWKVKKHLRLGAGYNFTDFSDNEFSDNNYSVQGAFVRVQSMF